MITPFTFLLFKISLTLNADFVVRTKPSALGPVGSDIALETAPPAVRSFPEFADTYAFEVVVLVERRV